MDIRHFVANSIPPVELDEMGEVTPAAVLPGTAIHDPPLTARDETLFLLTAAAEIEQVLMVQYLFAAYSVRVQGDKATELKKMQDTLLQIAREEMGHLVTVQNLLRLVGGPLHLGRDSTGDTASVAPFTFTLEPLTLGSLAKYVTAEAPGEVPSGFTDTDKLKRIRDEATAANGGQPVVHVGLIFERLKTLFGTELAPTDLLTGTEKSHARDEDWGYQPKEPEDGGEVIVRDFPGDDPEALRDAAVKAVEAIGAQGEGTDVAPEGTKSHFLRFFEIYEQMETLAGSTVTWPVVTNPNTSSSTGAGPAQEALDAVAGAGRITDPLARAWAQLFDLRYRMLLGFLLHFLHRDDVLYSPNDGPTRGDRTEHGLLLLWTFDEMRHLAKIAGLLVQLPKDEAGVDTVHAGPPFEMPYTVALPDVETLRWRTHLDVGTAAGTLINDRLLPLYPVPDPFLADVVEQDAKRQKILESLVNGTGIPAGELPTGFAKAVTVLEEAVRGFRIGVHGHFWADRTLPEFLATRQKPIGLNPDKTPIPDPDKSRLITRVSGDSDDGPRMPRARPAVPADRVAFLRSWIKGGLPVDGPPDQKGVHEEAWPTPPK